MTTEETRRADTALRRAIGELSTAATRRMNTEMPWFSELSAQDRSWVGEVLQAGIRGFIDWYQVDAAHGEDPGHYSNSAVAMFEAAPRALAGVITLQQTVDLVRLSIEVVENNIDRLLEPDDAPDAHAAVLRFAREVAFATAEVYARAAEVRGAWDARLEALVMDAVLRAETDESVLSRASAVGWASRGRAVVVLGEMPGERTESDLFDEVRRAAEEARLDALCAVQGERLVVLLGGVETADDVPAGVVSLFGEGQVVIGPVSESLSTAYQSARAALSGHRAANGWPSAPRPVHSDRLLPERALAGDGHARRALIEEVYLPLLAARGAMLETVSTYLERGTSIEATARELFVHPNTVRYRLRQASDLTGLVPTEPRDALALRVALILGRQSGRDL